MRKSRYSDKKKAGATFQKHPAQRRGETISGVSASFA